MEITVSARNLAVPDDVRQYAEVKIGRLGRFDGGMSRGEIRFSEERNPRIAAKERCEVTMYGHGHVVRAQAAAFEQFAAVDLVVEKLEHQLYKLKTRLKDRHRGKGHLSHDIVRTVGAADVPSDLEQRDGAETQEVAPAPVVVRTKDFEMPAMSVDDAITQLEMVGHDFYVFTDITTGELAVLYVRDDGDLGLIRRS